MSWNLYTVTIEQQLYIIIIPGVSNTMFQDIPSQDWMITRNCNKRINNYVCVSLDILEDDMELKVPHTKLSTCDKMH